jgi:hypothetical protein
MGMFEVRRTGVHYTHSKTREIVSIEELPHAGLPS